MWAQGATSEIMHIANLNQGCFSFFSRDYEAQREHPFLPLLEFFQRVFDLLVSQTVYDGKGLELEAHDYKL